VDRFLSLHPPLPLYIPPFLSYITLCLWVCATHAYACLPASLLCAQVILGRDYEQQQLQHMRELYSSWAAGLQDWPFLQLPFTRFGRAMAAREQLMEIFRAAIEETRGLLQQGQQVPGVLANLISAVDDEGNR
jgi:cytochrome P450